MMLVKLIKTVSQIRESLWKLTHIQNNKRRFRSMLTASANWFYRIYVYIDIIDIQDQTLPQKASKLLHYIVFTKYFKPALLWYDHLLAQKNLAVKIQ